MHHVPCTVFYTFAGVAILGQVIRIQSSKQAQALLLQGDRYSGEFQTIYPERGEIYDRNGHLLAGSRTVYEVGVSLKDMTDPHAMAYALSMYLGLSQEEVYSKLVDSPKTWEYIVVQDYVGAETVTSLQGLVKQMSDAGDDRLSGLAFKPHFQRSYPENTLASNLLGFVTRDGRGYFGIEIVGSTMAQADSVAPGRNVPTVPSQALGPTDPAELEVFLDDLFAKEMEENHIAGAAVSVVKDGKLFFAKGYGYAEIEKGIPVDPEQTIFGVGSVGKTITWTAVMQLFEQGKLDLDADINTYLDFRIPDTYPQPITLKHLLTHTSGFEDLLFEVLASDANDLVPVREWLVSHMPTRVRPPGYAGYSNYNGVLAGYIVARVSGQPYDQYIQEHILDPLGMAHSTAQSQVPPDLRALASVGYTYADGAFQAFPDYVCQPAGTPSGCQRASVTDMARYMIMQPAGRLLRRCGRRGAHLGRNHDAANAQHSVHS